MNNSHATLVELFSSIQGEGTLVGLRQVFIRFHGCNLSCAYCDTNVETIPQFCLLEKTPGRRDFSETENPVSLDRILATLDRWESGWPNIHHSFSITGGEPLLCVETLQKWLPELRKYLPIYLETNGVMSTALELVINHVDMIGMDIKLPSTSGQANLWEDHLKFLQRAAQTGVFVKSVVNSDTENWEIRKACDLIVSVDRSIPLILQPLTNRDGKVSVIPLKMLEFQEIASGLLKEVRIIPQTHKFMGQL